MKFCPESQLMRDFSGERVGTESEGFQMSQLSEFAGDFAGEVVVVEVEMGEVGEGEEGRRRRECASEVTCLKNQRVDSAELASDAKPVAVWD